MNVDWQNISTKKDAVDAYVEIQRQWMAGNKVDVTEINKMLTEKFGAKGLQSIKNRALKQL